MFAIRTEGLAFVAEVNENSLPDQIRKFGPWHFVRAERVRTKLKE